MGEDQGIKSLKLNNRKKNIFYPSEWTEGVDYEEPDEDYDPDETDDENNDDDLDENIYDTIDHEEVEELLVEPKGLGHGTNNEVIDNQEDEQVDNNEEENIVSDVDDRTLEEIVEELADGSTNISEV